MKRQSGFGAIMAIVILVILAALAAALAKFGTAQQLGAAQDVSSAKALVAARAGNEWGLFQALKGTWSTCSAQSQQIDLRADTGFWVTVTCDSRLFYDGQTSPVSDCATPPAADPLAKCVRVFRIESTACLSSTGCPDATASTSAVYVERKRQVIATN